MQAQPVMQLSHHDLYFAAQAGILRQISALARQRPEPHGAPSADPWGVHIESCIAEMNVSLCLNQSWRPFVSKPGELLADVGTSIQVRHTKHENGCLIVYDNENNDQFFVLVTGISLQQKVVGWIKGFDAKQQSFWKSTARFPAFFVPQHALSDISTLRDV